MEGKWERMPIECYVDCRHLIDADGLAAILGQVTLIDLRPAEDFALGHIESAKHLDIYAFSLNDRTVTVERPLS